MPGALMPGALRIAAPAKVNLYLGVHTEVDGAGYHRVDTVMAAIDLADEVALAPAAALSLACEPALDIPAHKNTAWRAVRALADALGRSPDVRIAIRKSIPVQAGLGGPSADAAAVIFGLCQLWGVNPADPRVVEAARSIGADVPFFLEPSPAYLRGRGDVMAEAFGAAPMLHLALVKPLGCGVSTPAAYRAFDAHPQPLPPLEPLLAALRGGRGADVAPLVANNLEPAACALQPRVGEVLSWLRARDGVLAATVCGSGACSFALCPTADDARRIAARAARVDGWWARAAACTPTTCRRMEN